MSDAFDVFLCHHSADKSVVKEVGARLRERGLKVWLDEWELAPGRPWQKELEAQIERIGAAAVFVGEAGFVPWQNQELRAFLDQFVGRGCPVIPVLLEGYPQPAPELPVFLRQMTLVDFRKADSDPLERLILGVTGEKPERPRRSQARDTSPDLELDVGVQHSRGRIHLTYRLRFATQRFGSGVRDVGSMSITADPAAYLKDLFGEIQQLRTKSEQALAQRRLVGIGATLLELFPMELRRQLWLIHERVRDPFTRWLHGHGDMIEHPFADVGLVVPKNSDLPQTAGEQQMLLDHDGAGRRRVTRSQPLGFSAGAPCPAKCTQAMMSPFNFAVPEVLNPARNIGPAVDVYSLATTATFALRGQPLPTDYYSDPGQSIAKLKVSDALKRGSTQATASEAEKRFAAIREFSKALDELRQSRPALLGDFTNYLRSLDQQGEPPSRESFELVWKTLQGALVTELKRRDIWRHSPNYVGIYGWESWQTSTTGDDDAAPSQHMGALDELTTDCYTYIFIDRIKGLHTHLQAKPNININGLIFLSIRHFLYERQKRFDPLGFRIFTILHSAVRQAVSDGQLYVLGSDLRIRNDTVLAFSPDAEPAAAWRASSGGVDLAALVERWSDDLLPDLVTALGKGRQTILKKLRQHLRELETHGVEVFFFKSVVDSLKSDVRRRWASSLERTGGETTLEDPQDGLEIFWGAMTDSSPDSLDAALAKEQEHRVRKAIDKLPAQMRRFMQLRFYQALNYREIAVLMKTSVDTVKLQLFQAHQRLKKNLDDYFLDYALFEAKIHTQLWYLSLADSTMSEVQVGQTVNLPLYLTVDEQPNSQPIRIPASALELTVYVEVPGFHLEGEHTRTLPVIDGSPIERSLFINLIPLTSGDQRVRVLAYSGREVIGLDPTELILVFHVAPPIALPDIPELIDRRTIPDPQPDVMLYMSRKETPGDQQIRVHISCPALELDRERLETPLYLTEYDLIGMRQASIQAATDIASNAPQDALAALRALGGILFDQLMPPGHRLRELYGRLLHLAAGSDTLWSWLVISDERTVLPWELVCPYGHRTDTGELWHDEFLASKFIVAHWVGSQGLPLAEKAPLGWLALTHYQQYPLELPRWQVVLGDQAHVETQDQAGHLALMEPHTRYYGLHLLRYTQSHQAGRITSYNTEEKTDVSTTPNEVEAMIHNRRLDFSLRRPVVGMSFLREPPPNTDQSALDQDTQLEAGWMLPFMHASASALIGPRWPVLPESDQLFYRTFYRTARAGAPIGWAVWNAREKVRLAFPHRSDWLAYTYFGHPNCEPYLVRESQGFTLFEVLDHPEDAPFQAGGKYRFRASYRAEAPVWYGGPLRAQEAPLADENISVMVMPLSADKPESYPLEPVVPGGDHHAVMRLTMPEAETTLPVMVRFQKGEKELHTLILNLDVIERNGV